MIRVCLQTTTDLKLIEKADGSLALEGLGAEQYLPTLKFTVQEQHPLNVSFYLTLDSNECIDRLTRNESDYTNVFIPISSQSPDYQASEVALVDKVQFLTGYSIVEGEIREKETATVFTNAHLLDPEVYVWCSSLIFSFCCFILLRVLMLRLSKREPHGQESVWQMTYTMMKKVLFDSGSSFRWIEFLYALVMFYMITSFLCLYKTSQVIVGTPFYPKTYEESLNHNSSLSYFYDQFTVVSKSFEDAPTGTVKAKMWKKLKNTGKGGFVLGEDDHGDEAKTLEKMTQLMREVSRDKSIVIAASTMIQIVKATLRGLSPDNELWVLKILSDLSESEIIYGCAIQKGSPFAKHISKRYRLIHESHLGDRLFEMSAESVTQLLSAMMGTSRKHQVRQMIILEDENAFNWDDYVKAIPFSYFREFFMLCLVIMLSALIFRLNSI